MRVCVCACVFVCVCIRVCVCVCVCKCMRACTCDSDGVSVCASVNYTTFCFGLAVVFILSLAEGKKRMCSCNGSWLFAVVISCYISITD